MKKSLRFLISLFVIVSSLYCLSFSAYATDLQTVVSPATGYGKDLWIWIFAAAASLALVVLFLKKR